MSKRDKVIINLLNGETDSEIISLRSKILHIENNAGQNVDVVSISGDTLMTINNKTISEVNSYIPFSFKFVGAAPVSGDQYLIIHYEKT